MKNILITGVNGFVGRNLVRFLSNNRYFQVTGVDVAERKSPEFETIQGFGYAQLDITDALSVECFFKGQQFDAIVHLAGILSKEENATLHTKAREVNFNSTCILLEMARSQSAHFVFTSTAMVYGDQDGPFVESMPKNPENYYALTKSLSEDMILYFHKKFGLNYTIFRPAILYGAGQTGDSFIPSLIRTLHNNENFNMTRGEQKRDFVYVDDFSMAIKLALETSTSGIFNIGTGTGVTIKQVAEMIAQKMQVANKLNLGALPYRENELWNYALSYDRLHKAIGWSPLIGIEMGVELILQDILG